MQIKSFTSLAAAALTLGAAAAQSAPRVLQIDETPGTQSVRAITVKPSEVRVLRAADGGEVTLAPAATGAPSAAAGGIQQAAQQGFLGVQLGGEGEGAAVMGLVDGGPAQKAKLQAGDRIVALDGAPVESSEALTTAIRGKRPGTVVKLTIARGEDELVQEITLGTRGGDAAAPEAEAPRARAGQPRQIELRTLDLDDDDDDEGDDEDDEDEDDQEDGQKKVRVRVGHVIEGGELQGGDPHRIEVRKEVHHYGDGAPQVKVWVNGKEVEPGEMGGAWVMEHGGDLDLHLEGLEALGEQLGGAHTFRFEGATPGEGGDFFVMHPGAPEGAHGTLRVDGHGMAPKMLLGGAAPELQRRVDELEGHVERLTDQVRRLEQMLHESFGGNQGQTRPSGGGRPSVRGGGASAGPSAPGNAGGGGVDTSQGQHSGTFHETRSGAGPGGSGGGVTGAPGGAMGMGGPRSGGNETDELRREMRELMRAIERLERQGGGQGSAQGGQGRGQAGGNGGGHGGSTPK